MLHWFRPAPSPPADLRFGREWLKNYYQIYRTAVSIQSCSTTCQERLGRSTASGPSLSRFPSLSGTILFSPPRVGATPYSRPSVQWKYTLNRNPVCSGGHAVQRWWCFWLLMVPTVLLLMCNLYNHFHTLIL